MSVKPIVLVGVPVRDAESRVSQYVKCRYRTAGEFDLKTGTWGSVDSGLVASTRIFSSRISHAEEDWFIEQSESAPWGLINQSDTLADADPFVVGGLYDRGESLWAHFAGSPIRGIAEAKISKVLHAMRPHFFPVLDSRIRLTYRVMAAAKARDLANKRAMRLAYWAAIREDIMMSRDGLDALRQRLGSDDSELLRTWVSHVSDVRLHDVVVWKPGKKETA